MMLRFEGYLNVIGNLQVPTKTSLTSSTTMMRSWNSHNPANASSESAASRHLENGIRVNGIQNPPANGLMASVDC